MTKLARLWQLGQQQGWNRVGTGLEHGWNSVGTGLEQAWNTLEHIGTGLQHGLQQCWSTVATRLLKQACNTVATGLEHGFGTGLD